MKMPPRESHLPTYFERTLMQKARASGELPIREARSPTIVKMLAKGWIERNASNAFRVTPTGEIALKAKMPLMKSKKRRCPVRD
jgi:hypothetical protein